MAQHLVLTVIGDDRPGLVGELSAAISAHQGNWLEASMAQLAGKFAGIVEVAVDDGHAAALKEALGQLKGLKVTVESAATQKSAPTGRRLKLALVGHDRIGIVREVSQALANHAVNVESLDTHTSSAPMSAAVLLRALEIAFDEVLHPFTRGSAPDFRAISPSGKVPWLVAGDTVVWDSLAIAEYLAERHPGVWPADAQARIWARCAAAEMHSGFAALRGRHGMNVGVRVAVSQRPPELLADIARIERLWNEGLARFGGPFLAGPAFTAVDAFFAPVVYRFRSYGVAPDGAAANYLATMLAHPAMREWEAAALAEDFRDPPHEEELAQIGRVTSDLRTPAR